MSRRGWLLFVAMSVIWGLPYLFIKVAVGVLTPASLVLLRTAVAALLLVPVAAAKGQLAPLLPYWRPLLVYTLAELGVPWLLLSRAEQRLSSSLAGLLIAAVPLVGAALAWATRTERLDARRILGLLVGLAGVGALVGLDPQAADGWALLEMGVVAVGYAIGPFVLSRYLSQAPGLGVVAASLAATALAYLIPGVVELPGHALSGHGLPGRVLGSVAVLAVVCTALAFLLFFALIDEVGPVRATVITYLNPAVAVALGVVFLHEHLTIGIGVGFVLVLAGSVLATRRSPVPGRTNREPGSEEALTVPPPSAAPAA